MSSGPKLLQRMGGREFRLASLIALVVMLAVAGGGHLYLESAITEGEEVLEEGRNALDEIRLRARDYLDSVQRKKALEEAIKLNDAKIQTAIDAIARRIDVTRSQAAGGEESTFDKVVRYEAKTTERPVVLGDKKKSRDKGSDFVELSQPVEYSFVKFIDLVRFLEQVESPERLMYVSKLVISRKYMEPDFVQGQMTIATFLYKPQKEEKEEEVEE